MNTDGRVVVWFSCGAASAVAARLAVTIHSNVKVVYCNTLKSESRDNLRFMREVEEWIEHPIEIISSKKFADIDEVFMKERYMSGVHGAPCTREMKKVPRLDFQLPNDLHIFGLTSDESRRISLFEKNNPDIEMEWILQEQNFTKEACFKMLRNAGIARPVMYEQGFKNNNCIGCVKSTSPDYWNRVRRYYPDVFDKRVSQSRDIGCKLIQIYQGKRIFLDELPVGYKGGKPEEDIECGVICVSEKGSE